MDELVNNPMILQAKNSLSPEEKERYSKIGEYMYNNDIYNTVETKIQDGKNNDSLIVGYAIEALKSGLHPKDLSESEIKAMIEIYGDLWYEKFNYTAKDLGLPNLKKKKKKRIIH